MSHAVVFTSLCSFFWFLYLPEWFQLECIYLLSGNSPIFLYLAPFVFLPPNVLGREFVHLGVITNLRYSEYPVHGNSLRCCWCLCKLAFICINSPTPQRLSSRPPESWHQRRVSLFYIASSWHWAHPSTLFMRAKRELLIWASEGMLFSDLHLGSLQHFSLSLIV